MSYFLFGSFDSDSTRESMQPVKTFAKGRGVNILFGEETVFYDEIERRENMDILFECLRHMSASLNIRNAEMFVTEGYDDAFERKVCTLSGMEDDLLRQAEDVWIASCIYRITE